jgi:hypothetical protein
MPGGISGIVFNDYNGNGIRDTGEPGMQNWKVLMTGSRVDSVFTDSGGLYSFKGLTAGTYTVTAQVPTGWNPTGPPGGSYVVSVTDGEQYPDREFGANQSATLAVSVPNGGEIWPVGSAQTITWNSLNLSGNVTIELSRNAGGSYEMLFPNAANDGSESWTVTSPLTPQALVRISSTDVPSVFDVSDNVFTVTSALSFLSQIVLHDNTALDIAGDTLHFGIAPGATDGIDAAFGEEELPPRPPAGAFDVRWEIAGTQGSKRDIRDTLGQTHTQVVYTGLLQAGVGGYPFWLRWEPAGLPTGVFTLRDKLTSGSYFTVNMKSQDSLVITNPAIPSFEIVYTEGASVSHSVQSGWNVVSLPVTIGNRQKSAVFPTAGSEAFGYGFLGYEVRDTLQYGEGYWIKFLSAQTLALTGGTRSRDTINLQQGWNMIGSITDPVPVDSIVQVPSGIVASQYFGYGAAGYLTADVIEPMQGYWVKASQNGKLVLSGSGSIGISSSKTKQR